MIDLNPRSGRWPRAVAPLFLAILAATTLGSATVAAAGPEPAPMVLQNVSLADIVANKRGICNGGFTHVIKNGAGANNVKNYLNAAQTCGLKVILHFPETVNHTTGTVYPAKVAYWVGLVKAHPNLYGYLTVKEPSWNRISAAEIRSLYAAFKKADPGHPVVAIFGDIPHFNLSANPYSSGMANIAIFDWYPVETANGGCSRSGTSYITTGPKWYGRIRAVLAAESPRTVPWLMIQTHKYLAPTCHKKQLPTEAQLRRQVSDGLTYLKATGIAFHVFENTNYDMDQRRHTYMLRWMRTIANQVHAGTF